MVNEEANRPILKIWDKYFPPSEVNIHKQKLGPLFFHEFKKNCILFVGMNPAFSEAGFARVMNGTEYERRDPYELYEWKKRSPKDEERWVNECVKADENFLGRDPFFTRFRRVEEFTGVHWEHIDLFFYKKTRMNDFLPMLYTEGQLNEFAKDQLGISLGLIASIEPKVIVVANAAASRIVRSECRKELSEFNERYGFHLFNVKGERVPIFFSSMLAGMAALDIGSFERLKWHIRQAIIMTRIPKSRFNPKECFCTVSDCGKCLGTHCTEDNCKTHRLVTKLRYRKRMLQILVDKLINLDQARQEKHEKGQLKEIRETKNRLESCQEEVKRIEKLLLNQNIP